MPGLGAVATTFIAGASMARRGLSSPIGSLTQLGDIVHDGTHLPINELVDLVPMDELVFGGWDIYEGTTWDAALRAEVLKAKDMEAVREDLQAITPMKAVFDQRYVRNINGPNVKQGANKMELAQALIDDIEKFKQDNQCSRAVGVWCGSTEVFVQPGKLLR